ncbi:tagatose 1,6-diphosphate aldolase [Candidimonas nitroreducens]|uniref:Tagatose-bisphosphate aldolase n=1 Tax=Candidimonas nitroreducens TaxID=683354 RepID=A0A225MU91_9BURK|nr:tagatose 1,6-diphosphate aldolase [Candidimonas nitroreducens]OWT64033.1 tagatose-bisphosphate aldolase [Candidimonas nitroreducens]
MTYTLRLGKERGLRRLADDQGHFSMVALDQRPPIINLIAKRRGIEPAQVAYADIVAAKRLLVEVLGSQASAMLFDPNYALPAGIDLLPARTGLVMTLEDHRAQDTPGGRLSHSIKDWNVEKIKACGADAVKVLAWYRPDAAAQVLEHQRNYVLEIGKECRRHDIPYVLELLVYPLTGSVAPADDYVEAPQKLPELVIDSVREFCDPRYGVDMLKLESPLPGATLPARDGGAEQQRVQALFDAMGDVCRAASMPWVMLSAGVTGEQFVRVMEYAFAAGAHGFLAGRAIWGHALQQFPDLQACRDTLRSDGLQTLRRLEDLARGHAGTWSANYAGLTRGIEAEGDFCAAYAP